MRAMRKKLNIFMLQLPVYYILEQKISSIANTDTANTKREKQIAFVAEKWMQCLLIAQVKILERQGIILPCSFYG